MKKITLILTFFIVFVSVLSAQEKGSATYYSSKLKGRHTTDGSRYHPDSLTCAHKTYPLGTYLLVKNPKNGEQVIVKVTDRGPFTKNMMIDLSYSAAKTLDIIQQGIANVEITKFDFLPKALTLMPTPQTYITVQQIYKVKDYMIKIFSSEDETKKK